MANDQRCKHGMAIAPGGGPLCVKCTVPTDAAKRMSEAIGLAILANPPEVTRRGWMAFALQDGNTDHVVYPSKAAAISHQSDEFRFCYLCLNRCMGGIPLKDAQLWLDLARHTYSQGGRLTDPKTDIIMPQGREQRITRLVNPIRRGIGRWDN